MTLSPFHPARPLARAWVAVLTLSAIIASRSSSVNIPLGLDGLCIAATTTSLPVQGGTTEVTATVTAANGQPAANFSVTFSGSNGTFSPASVITNASGVAKSTLRTTVRCLMSSAFAVKHARESSIQSVPRRRSTRGAGGGVAVSEEEVLMGGTGLRFRPDGLCLMAL